MKLLKNQIVVFIVIFALLSLTACSGFLVQDEKIIYNATGYEKLQEDSKISQQISGSTPDKVISIDSVSGKILKISSNTRIDLDNDRIDETISYNVKNNSYRLCINDREMLTNCDTPIDSVYVFSVPSSNGDITCIVASSEGSGGTPKSDVYCYYNKHIQKLGELAARPEAIHLTGSGFTCKVRTNTVQTWFIEKQYVLADANQLNKEIFAPPVLAEVPLGTYPVGTVVQLKKDLLLRTSRDLNVSTYIKVKKGIKMCISGCDNADWIYLSFLGPTKGEHAQGYTRIWNGGWIQISPKDAFSALLPDGSEETLDNLMGGLSHAG